MNTVTTKFEHGTGKSGDLKLKSKKKLPFSRVPAAMTAEDCELLRVTFEARDEWIENSVNFEHVHEEMLVDYYTYRLKACEARYGYFIKLVKEKGLSHYL